MTINFNDSLSRLRSRRLGYDRGPNVTIAMMESLEKSERYETRSTSQATRYTLGAMQQVDQKYTEICFEEAQRVVDQLKTGLAAVGRSAIYRVQGSVPLNTHIRGASDVDQLVLHDGAITYDVTGPLARGGWYSSYAGSVLQDVISLRRHCETILDSAFPKATVDRSGRKAIRISGGSLRREVDVVPAHWNDTSTYQESLAEAKRAVCILDKSVPETLENLPFLHIQKVHVRDESHAGGVKMAIRLLKNIKADTDTEIALSSYELAGLMWNAPDGALLYRPGRDLAILHATDAWLSALAQDYSRATSLRTPDNSRKIIDNAAKFTALVRLAAEVSALANEVSAEWMPLLKSFSASASNRSQFLDRVEIPA